MRSDEYYRNRIKREIPWKEGLAVALVWAVVQFAVSEAFHQAGIYGDNDTFYEISDLVAWPAGHIYTEQQNRLFRYELGQLDASPKEREQWDALLRRVEDPDDSEAYDALWEVFNAHSIDPTLSIATEYTIYIGVCVVWGILVGCFAVGVLFMGRSL